MTASPTVPGDPSALSGLVLWLDAGRLTGLAAGAAVSNWPDVSGAGHHATQSSAASRPTYQVNQLNGKAVVRFDGANDHLKLTGSVVSGATPRTVFVVAKPNSIGNKGFIDLGDGSANGTAFMLTPEHGVRVRGGNRLWNPAAVTGAPALFVVQLNGSTTNDLSAWLNGTALALRNTQAETIRTSGSGTVGSWSAAPLGIHRFSGDIAEIAVYARALSAAERQGVEHYFGTKYGLGLPGNSVPTATAAASPTPTPTGAVPSPTVNGPAPQSVPNLALWLDASALAGLGDGAPVSSWNDRSGQGHHATQATAASRPTLRTTALNGMPAVRFDGSDDFLALTGAVVSGAQPRTLFFVARPSAGGNRSIVDLGIGATSGGGFQISPEVGVRINGGSRMWKPAASTASVTFGVVQLTGGTTATLNLWINGVARAPSSTADSAVQTTGSGSVGRWTAGGNHFAGDIAELIVYGHALSASEQTVVEQYLRAKYDL